VLLHSPTGGAFEHDSWLASHLHVDPFLEHLAALPTWASCCAFTLSSRGGDVVVVVEVDEEQDDAATTLSVQSTVNTPMAGVH
jgi:hypothetical protein